MLSTARRVDSFDELTQPGDYYLNPNGLLRANPDEFGPTIWCCLPVDDPTKFGWATRITSPPWTFRECPDGSIEVRASIQVWSSPGVEHWHGYLDEGNVWRSV